MFCGIPVVATDNGGINDFISEINGIKVSLQDAEAVANSILKIKNGEIKFDKVQIRNSVMQKFCTVAFKQRMLDVYKGLLNPNLK
jgi:glycosyltransferase involved in cell wall biosynthesis